MLGNLFYRGLVLLRPVFIGDTLRTTTEVVGLRQNRRPRGTAGQALVVLRIKTSQPAWAAGARLLALPDDSPRAHGSVPAPGTPTASSTFPEELDPDRVAAAVPAGWRLDVFRDRCPGEHFADLVEGTLWEVEGRDTVTAAPELARLTLNLA